MGGVSPTLSRHGVGGLATSDVIVAYKLPLHVELARVSDALPTGFEPVAWVPGRLYQPGRESFTPARLRGVSVSEGQTVKMRQPIGTVYTNSEGTSELQFQLWRNSSNLNPENWIGRR